MKATDLLILGGAGLVAFTLLQKQESPLATAPPIILTPKQQQEKREEEKLAALPIFEQQQIREMRQRAEERQTARDRIFVEREQRYRAMKRKAKRGWA